MKKLILLFLLVGISVHSQIIPIPDTNFKAKLLSYNSSNTIEHSVLLGFLKSDSDK